MKVVDNFLSDNDFENLREGVLNNPNFSWNLSYGVADDLDGDTYFVHEFYKNHAPTSPHINLLSPVLEQIQPTGLIRIKGNLYMKSSEVTEHNMHTDYPYKHSGFIIYLNTCNGYTKLEDGTKVASIANRAMYFNSDEPHCSSTCTDDMFRANININYYNEQTFTNA